MNEYPKTCPVCGKYEYKVLGFSEVCPVCGWEDDIVQYDDPDYKNGANKMSLNEARELYKQGKKVK